MLLCMLSAVSCDDLIQYSLYDADTSYSDINARNIASLERTPPADDTLTIASFADAHNYYDDLRRAVKTINARNDIDVVIVGGDVTETGLMDQYESYMTEMKTLRVPFVTVIGNHDFLSNGAVIYRKMFGPVNFSFEYAGCRFIGFNDVVWENDNKAPDFDWLEGALAQGPEPSIVVAHIQPWTDAQLGDAYSGRFERILDSNRVILSIGGHCHAFADRSAKGIHYIIAGSVTTGGVTIVRIHDGAVIAVERSPY
jgi:predicted phosphodiesterase